MAIAIVKVYLEGTRPMLQNPASEELLERLRTGAKTVSEKGKKTRLEQARELLIRGPDGEMGIYAGYLRAAMVAGGRVVKNGRAAISTATSTKLPLLLTIEDEFMPFTLMDAQTGEFDEDYDPEQHWEPDMRRGTNPAPTGKGVMVSIVRPKITRWGVVTTLAVDLQQTSHAVVVELLKMTGKVAGIGDFRPGCKGDFGMFRVGRYELVEVRQDVDEVVFVGLDKPIAAPVAKATGKRGAVAKVAAKAKRNGRATEEDVEEAEEVVAAR